MPWSRRDGSLTLPRFFFDTDDGLTRSIDGTGLDLAGLEDVEAEALRLLQDLVHHRMPVGRRVLTVRVRDEHGDVVYRGEMTIDGQRY